MDYLLRDIINRRNPALVGAAKKIELGILTEEERKLLIDILTEELCSTGLGEDDEPNGRGLVIEDIIDYVNQLRERSQ